MAPAPGMDERVQALGCTGIDKSMVSRLCKELDEEAGPSVALRVARAVVAQDGDGDQRELRHIGARAR